MITIDIEVDGSRHEVEVEGDEVRVDGTAFQVRCRRDGTQTLVAVGDRVHVVDLEDARTAVVDGRPVPFAIRRLSGVAGLAAAAGAGHGPIKPPMAGRLESLAVAEGQHVARGDVLFVLEAMKMRNEVKAPADGVVGAIRATVGDTLDTGKVVLDLLPS